MGGKKRLSITLNIREMFKKISTSILLDGKTALEIINKLPTLYALTTHTVSGNKRH